MFHYEQGRLCVENVFLNKISQEYGTPVYVYSKEKILERLSVLENSIHDLPAEICFPVKCNFNLAILDILMRNGASFDIASGGELKRLQHVGADISRVVFTGPGKSKIEILHALKASIKSFHVESEQELRRIEEIAAAEQIQAPVSVRINPDVAAETHVNIATGMADTKFGVPVLKAEEMYQYASNSKWLRIVGVHCHIGSQIMEVQPYIKARNILLSLVDRLKVKGITLQFVDIGGGFGVHYDKRDSNQNLDWGKWIRELVLPICSKGMSVILEPGRFIMAEAGLLLTRVEYVKRMSSKNFCVVDAAMSDFIRPLLYGGYHEIITEKSDMKEREEVYDVVGPLCENDYLGLDRKLRVSQGDLVVVCDAGAYGSISSSNFSTRPRPPEVLVDGKKVYVIRERESYDLLMSLDHIPLIATWDRK